MLSPTSAHQAPRTGAPLPSGTQRTTSAATIVLAIAAFVIVTTEFLIIGLLPALARDLDVSITLAGQLVTIFAFVVMLCGPVLTAWLSHWPRKTLFTLILLIFAGSNTLAALAPDIWVLAIARIIPALALPVFWGTASETAADLAGPERAGRAVSVVYLGISAAMLFGIPLGTLAADSIGWRGAFWLLAILSLATALVLHRVMPHQPVKPRRSLAEQARILRSRFFVANVALSALVFTAMFTAYTYLADILETLAGIAPAHVGWWLMGFGAVGLIGNWLGGRWLDRSPLVATAVFTTLLALGTAATMVWADDIVWLVPALALWGIANTALYPICQVRVMKAAAGAQALAGTLNVSAANAGIGLGAIVGGGAMSAWGAASVGWVAAAIALTALALMPVVARTARDFVTGPLKPETSSL